VGAILVNRKVVIRVIHKRFLNKRAALIFLEIKEDTTPIRGQ